MFDEENLHNFGFCLSRKREKKIYNIDEFSNNLFNFLHDFAPEEMFFVKFEDQIQDVIYQEREYKIFGCDISGFFLEDSLSGNIMFFNTTSLHSQGNEFDYCASSLIEFVGMMNLLMSHIYRIRANMLQEEEMIAILENEKILLEMSRYDLNILNPENSFWRERIDDIGTGERSISTNLAFYTSQKRFGFD